MTVRAYPQRILPRKSSTSNTQHRTYQTQIRHLDIMLSCEKHPFPVGRDHCGSMPNAPAYRSMRLIKLSRKPREILNKVKRYTSQPNYNQEDHKRDFVRCYQLWKGMRAPNDAEKLQELQRDLRSAMKALGGFFFHEVLTANWHVQGKTAFKELKLEGNIFSKGHVGHYELLRTQDMTIPMGLCVPDADGQTTIYIDAFRNGNPQYIESIFETLVHEMAHAIFQSFKYRGCGNCNISNPAVLGTHGHGLVWVGMVEHMKDTIRTWDNALAKFYDTDDIRWHNRNDN